MKHRDLALAGVAASLFAVPALAHHSFAMFDQNKVNTLTGTVKQLEWVNPHAWLQIEITDANGKVIEVKGLGVVGQQPLLKPGESFEYTSGTHLETAVGTMRGTYQMLAEDGWHFDAPIPSFTLSVPRILH